MEGELNVMVLLPVCWDRIIQRSLTKGVDCTGKWLLPGIVLMYVGDDAFTSQRLLPARYNGIEWYNVACGTVLDKHSGYFRYSTTGLNGTTLLAGRCWYSTVATSGTVRRDLHWWKSPLEIKWSLIDHLFIDLILSEFTSFKYPKLIFFLNWVINCWQI